MSNEAVLVDSVNVDEPKPRDFAWGADEIGRVITRTPRQTHHLLTRGQIKSAKKVGGLWVASVSALLREFGALTKPSWRDVLPVHPAADLFPMMSRDELLALGEDIKANGLTAPILLWSDEPKDYDLYVKKGKIGKSVSIVDGRNRLDALEAVGIQVFDAHGRFDFNSSLAMPIEWLIGDDPYAVVISANIHRRHLTAEQKRDLIVALLKAQPHKSNRQVAKEVGASHPHIAKVSGRDLWPAPTR